MKRLKDIVNLGESESQKGPGIEPMDPGTRRFASFFKVTKADYCCKPGTPEAQDDLFTGSNMKRAVPEPSGNHGHVPGSKDKAQWKKHNTHEEAEQIDEISVNKAAEYYAAAKADHEKRDPTLSGKTAKSLDPKRDARAQGMKTAAAKLIDGTIGGKMRYSRVPAVKEEERLDEISRGKALDYINKAGDEVAKNVHRSKEGDEKRKAGNRIRGVVKASEKVTGMAKVNVKEEELLTIDEAVDELCEMWGLGMSDQYQSPEHHSAKYNDFLNRATDHKMQAETHARMMQDKNLDPKKLNFHKKALEAHHQLHQSYSEMAELQFDLLHQAHKNVMKASNKQAKH